MLVFVSARKEECEEGHRGNRWHVEPGQRQEQGQDSDKEFQPALMAEGPRKIILGKKPWRMAQQQVVRYKSPGAAIVSHQFAFQLLLRAARV